MAMMSMARNSKGTARHGIAWQWQGTAVQSKGYEVNCCAVAMHREAWCSAVAEHGGAAALRSTDRQGEGKARNSKGAARHGIAWKWQGTAVQSKGKALTARQWNGEAKKCEEQQGRGIDRIRPATERRRKGQRRSGKVLLRMHWHGREKKCRELRSDGKAKRRHFIKGGVWQ